TWFQRALETRTTALGEPRLSATTGKPAVNVAQPLLDSSGQVRRVVAVTIELEQLSRTAAQVSLPRGASFTLFDRSRMIVARVPSGGPWFGRQIPDTKVLQHLQSGASEDLKEAVGVDGVRRLYATVPVVASFDAGLYLGLGVDHDTAFADGPAI